MSFISPTPCPCEPECSPIFRGETGPAGASGVIGLVALTALLGPAPSLQALPTLNVSYQAGAVSYGPNGGLLIRSPATGAYYEETVIDDPSTPTTALTQVSAPTPPTITSVGAQLVTIVTDGIPQSGIWELFAWTGGGTPVDDPAGGLVVPVDWSITDNNFVWRKTL